MYNATKDDLTAVLHAGLDGVPPTHRGKGISTTSCISMVSVKHIDYAPQARKGHKHLCKYHCLCHYIELFVVERMQIKALLKYNNNVHIYHLLNIKRPISLKQRPVRCLR